MSYDHLEEPSHGAQSPPQPPSCPPPPSVLAAMTFTNTETAATAPSSPSQPASLAVSASAPQIHSPRALDAASVPFSPSFDSALTQSSRNSSAEALPGSSALEGPASGSASPPDVDPTIIQALRSKDRLWVLKLGEMMEGLINDRRERIDLNPQTTYQRLLVHRCSGYYSLSPRTDTTTKVISVHYSQESRIPARRLAELVPVEESAQPAIKIMRRDPSDRRTRQNSQPGSVAGDDADVSDLDPSETGSVGGRSTATSGTKRHPTIEEREAAYNEARSRIFMDFDEKEKEKDASANSSTLSLVSGSAGRSSAGEGDDAASSAATESEWSGPANRHHGRRAGSSTRSYRSSQGSYNPSASGSSRNSRATSPSFTYPSLYDPSAGSYDQTHGAQGPPQGYMQYYYPPYPAQGPGQPFLTPYQYAYSPYGYSPPHQQSPHPSEPVSPSGEPVYGAPQSPPHMTFQPPGPFMWAPPPPAAQATSPSSTPTSLPAVPVPSQSPPHMPPQNMGPYPGYFAPPGYPQPYPMPGYYPPPAGYPAPAPAPSQPMPPPPIPGPQPQFYPDVQPTPDPRYNNGNGTDSLNHSRTSSRNSNGHGSSNGNNRRGPAPQRRSPWNYTPSPIAAGMAAGPIQIPDSVGPRMGSRRTSSGSQGTGGNRTPGDESSSVTSSSSSSSRRTMTSTSSKHPLPPRPDWAVGLKAQPTLSGPRHHDHANPNSRTMSPARLPGHLPNVPYQMQQPQPNQQQQQRGPSQPQPVLQATDFPPLSSGPGKKTPVAAGAWTNSSNIRSALRSGPPPSSGQAPGPPMNASQQMPPPSNAPGLVGAESVPVPEDDGYAGFRPAVLEGGADGLAERLDGLSLEGKRAVPPLAVPVVDEAAVA